MHEMIFSRETVAETDNQRTSWAYYDTAQVWESVQVPVFWPFYNRFFVSNNFLKRQTLLYFQLTTTALHRVAVLFDVLFLIEDILLVGVGTHQYLQSCRLALNLFEVLGTSH